MTLLSKDAILQAQDIKTEDVDVPEWGGKVRVRVMSGFDRDAFEQEMITGRSSDNDMNLTNFRARLAGRCIVGEDGKRLFDTKDLAALGRKSSIALDRVVEKCKNLNGMSDEDVEVLTEGFDKAPGDDSSSE